MPELYTVHAAAKVRCFGRPAALDGLEQPPATMVGRIAPDEVVYVGPPGTGPALTEALEAQLADQGDAALVIDHTDGWTFFSLVGEGLEEVFCRVSAVRLPDASATGAFTVGKICDVAAKAFVRPGRVDIMTGSEVRIHVTERLDHAGHALGLEHVAEPAADPLGLGVAEVTA